MSASKMVNGSTAVAGAISLWGGSICSTTAGLSISSLMAGADSGTSTGTAIGAAGVLTTAVGVCVMTGDSASCVVKVTSRMPPTTMAKTIMATTHGQMRRGGASAVGVVFARFCPP
ncbi:hypothetical protein FG002_017890 [Chitinimonas sp. BJB300]|nr:hypothetical protein FG002_017890 [Chitinimonas sp. BJB300]